LTFTFTFTFTLTLTLTHQYEVYGEISLLERSPVVVDSKLRKSKIFAHSWLGQGLLLPTHGKVKVSQRSENPE
jgi:hypothetical protein